MRTARPPWRAASTVGYGYTEDAFLNDYGAWLNQSGSGSATATASQNWSLSGSSPSYTTTIFGNAASGTLRASGSGAASTHYTQYYTFTPVGQWQLGSGSGGSSGSGTLSSQWSANGSYSIVDPDWYESDGGGLTGLTAANLGSAWSGTVSGSADSTVSFGYSTSSVFSSSTGAWSTTGSASTTVSASASCSFSAGSPFLFLL